MQLLQCIVSVLQCIISIACTHKDLGNFFMQSSPLYLSCLFSMLLNDDIVDIAKPGGICLSAFTVD